MSNVNSVSSVNLALAFLTATHNAEQAALDSQKPTFTVKVTKEKVIGSKAVKVRKNNGSQAAPIHGATVFGLAMPDKTYSEALSPEAQVACAITFILAMRTAGKRMVDGKLVFQEREMRNDQIQAIAAFIGYDNRALFGTQDTAARMLAQRLVSKVDVKAGPDRQAQRQSDLSAKGFVAGLPAPVAAKLADLKGREELAAAALIQHEKDGADVVRGEYQCELSRGLALVEAERLAVIREDIKRLTF